jgi:hypothetical protein
MNPASDLGRVSSHLGTVVPWLHIPQGRRNASNAVRLDHCCLKPRPIIPPLAVYPGTAYLVEIIIIIIISLSLSLSLALSLSRAHSLSLSVVQVEGYLPGGRSLTRSETGHRDHDAL